MALPVGVLHLFKFGVTIMEVLIVEGLIIQLEHFYGVKPHILQMLQMVPYTPVKHIMQILEMHMDYAI